MPTHGVVLDSVARIEAAVLSRVHIQSPPNQNTSIMAHRRMAIRHFSALMVVVLASISACMGQDGRAGEWPEDDIRELITRTMEVRLGLTRGTGYERRLTAGFPDSIRFTSEPSGVVPRLTYHVGAFRPTGSDHGDVEVLAAQLHTHSAVITSPSEWSALVSRGHWRATAGNQARQVCEEIVIHVLRPAGASVAPIIFRDSASLSRAQFITQVDRSYIMEAAVPPVVREVTTGREWDVELWSVEASRTVKYQCRVGGQNRDALAIAPTDSIPCVGQLASCGIDLQALRRRYGSRANDPEK